MWNWWNWIKRIPVHMDYEGQKLAERIFHGIIISFGTAGFLWGYYIQQFSATILVLAAGFTLSCLYKLWLTSERIAEINKLVLPPWPFYRKHPLDWQRPRPEKSDTKRDGGKKRK